jgi:multidrug efflux pump
MAESFPKGMSYEIRYDTTPFIRESIEEVQKTLGEAVILVAVVVLLFLQNWRSAIIPLIAVPVGIIGTFAIMLIMGFSINNLTLFGLVLAIGIVVDDAIVVVEAVEHHMERGLAPRDATIIAMSEVSGPVIAIGLVLSAVFVPCAFISGIVGQFFRQFALTIAASTLISTLNSLTLSPALAALILKPKPHGSHAKVEVFPPLLVALLGAWIGYEWLSPVLEHWTSGREIAGRTIPSWAPLALSALVGGALGRLLSWLVNEALLLFFRAFNAAFQIANVAYVRGVGILIRGSLVVLVLYGGLLYLTYVGFVSTPTGFIPSQDMGYLMANIQLPDSTSFERTSDTMDEIERIAHTEAGVQFTVTMAGRSLLLNAEGANFGTMFIVLNEFKERQSPELYYQEILNRLRAKYTKLVPDAIITLLGPPPVRGVGRAGGFKIMVEDLADKDLAVLQGQTENLVEQANGQPQVANLTSVFRANVPQLYVDIDRGEVVSKQVPLGDLYKTLQIFLGSLHVNDFNLFGRTWQVILQADSPFRDRVEVIKRLKVRNKLGQMVPLGSLADFRFQNSALILTRYNMRTAASINGSAAPGVSSGDAIAIMEQLGRRELPKSMTTEWTELAYFELQAGNTAMVVFGFAVVMVFLVLAAQYESWALPMAVILVVPLCLLCSIAGVRYAGQDINIFTQVGFVVLVGLACKNAILIVEFARAQRQTGLSRREAALSACRLRLRPIVMTSMAFILGVVPLLVSTGAGAEMRVTLGTTVFSGMLGVTLFGIVLTPVFFVMVDWVASTRLFHNRLTRRLSTIFFGIFALGYVRHLAARVASRAALKSPSPSPHGAHHPERPPVAASGNGHANGNGNGNGHAHDEIILANPPASASEPPSGGLNGHAPHKPHSEDATERPADHR